MALNWQNNGETVRLSNDGSTLSHSAADIKGGDLVFVGVDNTDVALKGVAMTDIVLLANISEFHYNEGSVCRIGEWLFGGILTAAVGQFQKLNYNWTDKIFTDDDTAGKIAIAAISRFDPRVEPKTLIDATDMVTLTTFAAAGTGAAIGNEVFEITVTRNSDLGATSPLNALFSIRGNGANSALIEDLESNTAIAALTLYGANSFTLQIDHTVDLYEGQKFWIATLGDNSGADVVTGAGMLVADSIIGAHMTVGTTTVDKGLNQDEGPQGNVGRLPVIINI